MEVTAHGTRPFGDQSRQGSSYSKRWSSRSGNNTPAGDSWERARGRGRGRGGRGTRGSPRGGQLSYNSRSMPTSPIQNGSMGLSEEDAEESYTSYRVSEDPVLETLEEREAFFKELLKAREAERKQAIAEGKLDDPQVRKRLEDAITVVGTCMDMCPRFERYRRDRENNLFEWEMIPGTRRVDHNRAVKMYERAAGDKIIPSDLRPPQVLKRTLDYLFHDLLTKEGLGPTYHFIRDRSRAVRNDFTLQRIDDNIAMESVERCVRFHILVLHNQRDDTGFEAEVDLRELRQSLQSLKEFYMDRRKDYESAMELEMRVYSILVHIRDQVDRKDEIPEHVLNHPVYQLTRQFRARVQKISTPITKKSALHVDGEAMQIFSQLANTLRDQGNTVMIYLVACLLEYLFGRDTIEDMESIKGDLSIADLIDGHVPERSYEVSESDGFVDEALVEQQEVPIQRSELADAPPLTEEQSYDDVTPIPTQAPLPTSLPQQSAFSNLSSTSVFNTPAFGSSISTFAPISTATSTSSGKSNIFGRPPFGTSSSTTNVFAPISFNTGTNSPIPTSKSAPPDVTSRQSADPFAPTPPDVPNPFNVPAPTPALFPPTAPPTLRPFNVTPSPALASPTPSQPFSTTPLNPAAPIFSPSPSLLGTKRSEQPSVEVIGSPLDTPPQQSSNWPLNKSPAEVVPAPIPSPSFTTTNTQPLFNQSAQHSTLPKLIVQTNPVALGPMSPAEPPPLGRVHPVALPPSTPTVTKKPTPGFFKNSLMTAFPASSSQEILSPLALNSPSGFGPVSPFSTRKGKHAAPVTTAENSKSIAVIPYDDTLKKKLLDFLSRSCVVKDALRRWHQRSKERIAYENACRDSEDYRSKVQLRRSTGDSPNERKRRRASAHHPAETIPVPTRRERKRPRQRQPTQTDDELAARFKENHEEHLRRWAQGSLLHLSRIYVANETSMSRSLASCWRIWLSTNSEIDATAIWLQCKFDVPDSGDWKSDSIFSIPLIPNSVDEVGESPGLVVFECTPLDGITDDLERKYRVLDDCSRLRDIVDAFPPRGFFVPSILFFHWAEAGNEILASDFELMVQKLKQDGKIASYRVFSLTSKTIDTDGKFSEALSSMNLDIEGQLVRPLTLKDVFRLFDTSYQSFLSDWMENCSVRGPYNWALYNRLLQSVVSLLNEMGRSIVTLVTSSMPAFQLDPLTTKEIDDSDSAFEEIGKWLQAMSDSAPHDLALDVQSHCSLGRQFPARLFAEQLYQLMQFKVQSNMEARKKYNVLTADITSATDKFSKNILSEQAQLSQALNFSSRRSPKRRSISEDRESISSEQSKRRRLSPLTDPMSPPAEFNGMSSTSPSPSESVASDTNSSVVTIAMLRALTRDMRKKYASNA